MENSEDVKWFLNHAVLNGFTEQQARFLLLVVMGADRSQELKLASVRKQLEDKTKI
jgi:hypothetical protein